MDALTEQRRAQEVHRLLQRYLIEVVEEWVLCPWALGARVRGEVHAVICWGETCDADQVCQRAARAVALPGVRVAMLIFPELTRGARALEELRTRVLRALPEIAVAAFGPHGELDLASPARLVPLLRRSPDPMLQLVPHDLLDELKRPTAPPGLGAQARALRDLGAPPPTSVVDELAARNHAAVAADGAERLQRTLEELAADRAASYARVGIRVAS
ncbi:MAG: hypothetical protein R3B48_14040 [Kofleriaceae bacterium]